MIRRFFWFVALALVALLCAQCADAPRRARGFFYWQTTLELSTGIQAYLDSLPCKVLYVKILDVGRSPADRVITPFARLHEIAAAPIKEQGMTPCVFLTNSVFEDITEPEMNDLLHHCAGEIRAFLQRHPQSTPQVQFDCDWTARTRSNYFNFLKKIRPLLPESTCLSATVRLHQYKFPDQTGVPPVDRGMLMCYNTGDIEDWATKNSIFDADQIRKYTENSRRYPRPLDLALPLFSWTLAYRDGQLWKILPELDPAQLADTACFARENAYTWYVRRATLREGHYLRPGDLLRRENTDARMLQEAGPWLQNIRLANDAVIAFFDLDSTTARRFPVQTLQSVCRPLE